MSRRLYVSIVKNNGKFSAFYLHWHIGADCSPAIGVAENGSKPKSVKEILVRSGLEEKNFILHFHWLLIRYKLFESLAYAYNGYLSIDLRRYQNETYHYRYTDLPWKGPY